MSGASLMGSKLCSSRNSPIGSYFYPYFPEEKTKSQWVWMTCPQCHRVSLWLSQNLHLDLPGCTIVALSPQKCCAYIYSEGLHCPGCTPQQKQYVSSCDVSGCPHLDDILRGPWIPGLLILKMSIINSQAIWSQAPCNCSKPYKGD